jgi:hypothetical protein
MSANPQQVRRSGFSKEAFGALKDRVINKEDHGPKYVYSPGEPMHRIDNHDGVPHVYPGVVRGFESYINWHTSYTKPEVGTTFTAEQANDMTDKMRYGAPIYAGSIATDITQSLSGTEKCIVSITAFENMAFEDTRWEEFNAIIMPEPVFYDAEEVPLDLLPRWRSLAPEINEKCRKIGGLAVREEYLKNALRQFQTSKDLMSQMYVQAITQMLGACEAFRRFAITYLETSDRSIDDRNNTGKNIYDTRDLRLQWLTAHKSKSAQEPQQIIVQSAPAPAVTDIERLPCSECGEMISVNAKVCVHCKTRFDKLPTGGSEVTTVAEVVAQRKRKSLEEKQAEAQERHGK